MAGYVVRRLLTLVPIALGVTFVAFALMHAAGGDAVQAVYANSGMAVSQSALDAQRAELGLDRSFLVQYFDWLGGMLTGNMGESLVSGQPVSALFAEKLPNTILLAIAAALVTVAVSLPLGVLAAVRRGGAFDRVVRALSFVGNALPNFFVALLLILVFSVRLKMLPVLSVFSEDVSWQSLALPTATLAVAMAAKYVRQVRAVVLEELGRGYVRGCRARGVRGLTILVRDVLKNGMLSLSTLLALSVGDLLGGAAIVESVFMWDGVGKLAVDSIAMRDYPVILAYVVWMALIYVCVNLAADIAYSAIDPRVRLHGKERLRSRRARCPRVGDSTLCADAEGSPGRRQNTPVDSVRTGFEMPETPRSDASSRLASAHAGLVHAASFVPFAKRSLHASAGEPTARRVRARRDFTKRRLAVCATLAGILLLVCALAPLLCPHDPYAQNMAAALQVPSFEHPFGTDRFGRDVLSRVIMGAQSSVSATLALVSLTVLAGTLVGVVCGWCGGRLDAVLMRASDVFLSFPGLVFALAFAAVAGGGVANAVLALAIVGWPKYARLARSQVLSVKSSPYFDAARLAGCTMPQIVVRHVLPNIAGVLFVTALLDVGAMMMELAGLSYLGLGAQPPLAEWGSMMSDGRSMLQTAPWTILAPGLAIFVTVAVANLLGDAVRDWLDPRLGKEGAQ